MNLAPSFADKLNDPSFSWGTQNSWLSSDLSGLGDDTSSGPDFLTQLVQALPAVSTAAANIIVAENRPPVVSSPYAAPAIVGYGQGGIPIYSTQIPPPPIGVTPTLPASYYSQPILPVGVTPQTSSLFPPSPSAYGQPYNPYGSPYYNQAPNPLLQGNMPLILGGVALIVLMAAMSK